MRALSVAAREDDRDAARLEIGAEPLGKGLETLSLAPARIAGHLKDDGRRARDQRKHVVGRLEGRGHAGEAHSGEFRRESAVEGALAVVNDEDFLKAIHVGFQQV